MKNSQTHTSAVTMTHTPVTNPLRPYSAPSFRMVPLASETSFLASNTEPIVDDGEEHGWD